MLIDTETWNWMVEMAESAPDFAAESEDGVAALCERICEMGREE